MAATRGTPSRSSAGMKNSSYAFAAAISTRRSRSLIGSVRYSRRPGGVLKHDAVAVCVLERTPHTVPVRVICSLAHRLSVDLPVGSMLNPRGSGSQTPAALRRGVHTIRLLEQRHQPRHVVWLFEKTFRIPLTVGYREEVTSIHVNGSGQTMHGIDH